MYKWKVFSHWISTRDERYTHVHQRPLPGREWLAVGVPGVTRSSEVGGELPSSLSVLTKDSLYMFPLVLPVQTGNIAIPLTICKD